jgi:hypothetical protein
MSGEPRRSAEAVARNREQSRLRAAARRESRSEQEHETHLKERREYEAKNAEHINAARQTRYGNDHEMALASRPFIGWDGEGYRSFAVDPSGEIDELHHYMLFGNSRMPDEPITSRDLTTKECLDYMFRVESLFPDAFHVGFAFDYDVNMILVDLSSRHLKHLAEYGMCHWSGYRIAYIPSKMFRVSRGPKEARESITIFDTFGFFHCKYTTALIKFGVATDKELAHIMEGKDRRGSFTYRDMEYVKEYWQDEISFFPPLTNGSPIQRKLQRRCKLQHSTPMQAEDSRHGDAVFIFALSILPISTQHTSMPVVCCPGWITGDGYEPTEIILTGITSHDSVCIESHSMTARKGNKTTANGVHLAKSTLYSVVIDMEVCAGRRAWMDGIGVRRHSWSLTIRMPAFWKPGFTTTMGLILSGGSVKSLLSV